MPSSHLLVLLQTTNKVSSTVHKNVAHNKYEHYHFSFLKRFYNTWVQMKHLPLFVSTQKYFYWLFILVVITKYFELTLIFDKNPTLFITGWKYDLMAIVHNATLFCSSSVSYSISMSKFAHFEKFWITWKGFEFYTTYCFWWIHQRKEKYHLKLVVGLG